MKKLCWLFGEATLEAAPTLEGCYVGPRREMITPWSTNAVEITQNMNLSGILRIEEFFPVEDASADHDPMLQRLYEGLHQDIFTISHTPEPIRTVEDLDAYNEQEGLALSPAEAEYLHGVEQQLGRNSPIAKSSALHNSILSTADTKSSVVRSSSMAKNSPLRSLL